MIAAWIGLGLGLGVANAQEPRCAQTVTALELSRTISSAEAAFQELDEAGFREAHRAAVDAVPCLSSPMNEMQVSRFYKIEAFYGFLERDEAASLAAFEGLLDVSPRYILPYGFAPIGHPLQQQFEQAQLNTDAEPVALEPPRRGVVWIDGIEAAQSIPTDRPYIFHQLTEDGRIAQSRYLEAGTTPEYLRPRSLNRTPDPRPEPQAQAQAQAQPEPSVEPEPEPSFQPEPVFQPEPEPEPEPVIVAEALAEPVVVKRERSVSRPLLWTAGAAAVLAGTSLTMGYQRQAVFNDPTTARADLAPLRQQTNTLSIVGVSAGALAVGTGAAGIITLQW